MRWVVACLLSTTFVHLEEDESTGNPSPLEMIRLLTILVSSERTLDFPDKAMPAMAITSVRMKDGSVEMQRGKSGTWERGAARVGVRGVGGKEGKEEKQEARRVPWQIRT